MPYIRKEERPKFNPLIDELAKVLLTDEQALAGNLNYVVSSLLRRLSKNLRYVRINELMGVLECVKQEYYRRIAAVYEDEKIRTNGDV